MFGGKRVAYSVRYYLAFDDDRALAQMNFKGLALVLGSREMAPNL